MKGGHLVNPGVRKALTLIAVILGIFLAIQYLLPLFLPFLLGAGLALAAEPMVHFFCRRLHMPRSVAAGIGVSTAFSFLALLVLLLCGLIIRELRVLAGILPGMEDTILAGMGSLSGWLLELVQRAPESIRALLTRNVTDFFSSGSALLERVTNYLLHLASGILSHVPDSALLLGTGIISSFMISAKLPKIRAFLRNRLPVKRFQPVLAVLSRLKTALGGWLKAQLKLSGVTFLILTVGFFALGVSYAPLWALMAALVDAFPVLGTGTVLIPWSLVSFLQGDHIRAFGLLGLYAAVALTRSVLEPRLVGKQLGLDPLVTLAALYTGYRLWGLGGMLLAPMLAVVIAQFFPPAQQEPGQNM